MKLHEAIYKVLKDTNRPMKAKEIAVAINQTRSYVRKDNAEVKSSQILQRVKNYPALFENINGLIIGDDNKQWKNVIKSYQYLRETLRGYLSDSDVQFVTAVLFFYKRLVDINARPGRGYPIEMDHFRSQGIDYIIDKNGWTRFLQQLDDYVIAPVGIFEEGAKLLSGLPQYKQSEILSILVNVDTTSFADLEFGDIYEYLLYQNSKEHLSYEHSTPETIRLLLPELLSVKNKSSVYDPVAGVGGLLSKVLISQNDILLSGSEINNRIAQLGNMNLMMYGCANNEVIISENCFEEINNNKRFDYILGDLPLNGINNVAEYYTLYRHFNLQPSKTAERFSALILFSFYKLSDSGKAVITTSDSFLTRDGKEKRIREILLRNDAIESIISLPRGTYRPYTEAKPSIIVLNKNKPTYLKNKIKFIKARAIEENNKWLLLDIEEIVHEYQSEKANPNLTQIIDQNDIRDDLNLSADVYDAGFFLGNQMLKEGTARLLKDIVIIKLGRQPNKDELIADGPLPVVKIENLTKEILDINLDVTTISSKIYDKKDKAVIAQSCVLIAKIGDSIKPTIFRPTRVLPAIFIHSGVIALIPKDGNLDLEYLYYQLNTTLIEDQVDSKKTGSLIRFISKKELEEVIIPYPDVNAQRAFRDSQKANLVIAERNKTEQRIKALGYKEDAKEAELNIVRTITHQLKHNLTEIDLYIKKAKEIINKNQLGNLKEYQENDPILTKEKGFESPENYTLQQSIDRAEEKSTVLNQILTDVKKAIHLELVYAPVNIYELLNEIKKEFTDISIDVKGDKDVELEVSKSHIKDMFDTLIKNALEHAGLKEDKLKINFSIKKEIDSVKIDYRNNGKPLAVSAEQYKAIATKSTTSNGTGVGGYYVNKIIEAHKGHLTLYESISAGVHMIIELPLK